MNKTQNPVAHLKNTQNYKLGKGLMYDLTNFDKHPTQSRDKDSTGNRKNTQLLARNPLLSF